MASHTKNNNTDKMSAIKKALKLPWKLGKRYNVLDGKENTYINTPKYKERFSESDLHQQHGGPLQNRENLQLRRNTSLTRSVRDAVGSLRQRIRMSTRRRMRIKEGPISPSPIKKHSKKPLRKTPPRNAIRTNMNMYEPFHIDTPTRSYGGIRTNTHMMNARRQTIETPTRLRKEVEDLTSNMQALTTLTPCTLQQRARTRRSVSPLTNGSLRSRERAERRSMRLQARRKIETSVY